MLASTLARADSQTHTISSSAPSACAASWAPSSTRWGSVCISVRSFRLAGSPSAALTTTTARLREAATARSFVAVGKPAPPCPRRPARSSCSIRGDSDRRPRRRARGGRRAVDGEVLVEAHRAIGGDARQQSRQRAGRLRGRGLGGRVQHEGLFAHSPLPCEALDALEWCSSEDGVPGASRPFRSERSAGHPDRQEQRERAGAPERGAAPTEVLRPAVGHARDHRREHGQQAERRSAPAAMCSFTSLPVPKPCSSAIGQLAYVSQWIARQLA